MVFRLKRWALATARVVFCCLGPTILSRNACRRGEGANDARRSKLENMLLDLRVGWAKPDPGERKGLVLLKPSMKPDQKIEKNNLNHS